jgi:hypothetical protein
VEEGREKGGGGMRKRQRCASLDVRALDGGGYMHKRRRIQVI